MARVLSQSDAQKSAFRQRIQTKQWLHEQAVRDRINSAAPKLLHWALKPLAIAMVRSRQHRDSQRGEHGEFAVKIHLWARLPKTWTIMNDVVLEYEPGEYTQIDHIALGPHGIYLLETKAWNGAILLKNDQCFRKVSGKWIKTDSPISQNQMHHRRFVRWYQLHGLPEPCPTVQPLVVFTQAKWLAAEQCSMPVLTVGQALSYLTRRAEAVLEEPSIDRIAQTLLTATPLPVVSTVKASRQVSSRAKASRHSAETGGTVSVRKGTTRDGRKYVRIHGTKEAATKVWENHGKPGKLAPDRFEKDTFFFYDA